MKNAARSKKRIYLDYAATTPADPRVLRAMEPYFGVGTSAGSRGAAARVRTRATSAKFGNPGSLHSFGQQAIAAVDHARETIARSISAEFREIIFTSSATEANNLALRGIVKAVMQKWKVFGIAQSVPAVRQPRIIISAIEHESILETAHELERDGAEAIYLPVDHNGIVDLEKLKASLDERTVLVSIMYANNEIGAIQPIAEIAKIIKEFRAKQAAAQSPGKTQLPAQLPSVSHQYPLFHTDAAQAFQFLNCNVRELGVDLMTLSSHKIYGSIGAAVLYVRNMNSGRNKNIASVPLEPIIFGGGQEFGLRSGTENVPAIVGFAKAVELTDTAREKESKRIAALRDRLWLGIKKICPKAEWNGAEDSVDTSASTAITLQFLPNILNVYFPGTAAQDLLTRFDLAGIAVSSGSACRSRAFEASYVIEALGGTVKNSLNSRPQCTRAKSSIRFSLGRLTTAQEIDATLAALNSFRII